MTQHKVMSRYFLVIDAIKYKIIKTFVDFKKEEDKIEHLLLNIPLPCYKSLPVRHLMTDKCIKTSGVI